ncbi:MAG: sulfur carrier protein ThiS [Spirochaetota bacterium]
MTITVNGEGRDLGRTVSVVELLASEKVESPDMVAVQLNGSILDRAEFATTRVADGDAVEFLYFMGGGSE